MEGVRLYPAALRRLYSQAIFQRSMGRGFPRTYVPLYESGLGSPRGIRRPVHRCLCDTLPPIPSFLLGNFALLRFPTGFEATDQEYIRFFPRPSDGELQSGDRLQGEVPVGDDVRRTNADMPENPSSTGPSAVKSPPYEGTGIHKTYP